ncbi:invasion associated locus B family protein [Devosia sp. YIM 151766]|uniref:invasion associated locus B family protein n=1 Tax=Devosia sp. YIM 151766 TaxID=3017325 RepID=UPI00255C785F|nr:invasion associated locus B family protein [Devosia sp. YIM 151766]WIY52790.1 invasion associated locus B family protein [Devosia sp. YIM 151766]
MTTKPGALAIGLAAAAIMALAPAAQAQQATELGTFNAWSAYTASDQSGQLCFIIGEPQRSEPAGVNRDPIKFLIVHRKGMGSKNEAQTQIGYPYNTTDAKASVAVDGRSYVMAARGSTAWLASSGDEAGFVAAFKAGNQMVVRGTSQRGTDTVDTYSLSGATAAMNAIDAACQ